ncbi:hydroxypyruvate isomerase [Hymenobacter sp. UV11]|uniref:hydroxypyruvate isomerase family protein n=1 Tax=Hymenobacter sp. UV11 TaxID=1849735 RepID=UPI00105C5B64|nr:TIM barrel protein [Hymenobacter sp. UV11]TDN40204.1 hydroxypyruvate isomerase [Hymenobacter sp. UV11]TFZ64893.1 hydroxypyruvate isomerase [Hymenobacter sp. UV11]
MPALPTRRTMLKNVLAGTAAVGVAGALKATAAAPAMTPTSALKNNIKQSVCRWCYQNLTLDQLCAAAKEMGLKGIDLVGPKEWPTLKKYGLDSPMCNGAEINLTDGFNDPRFHAQLQKQYAEMIPLVGQAGYTNLICFSGSRRGMSDETGWANCVQGLTPLLELAAKHKVVLVMELLNSKIDHKDYQCDRTSWGVALAKKLGSEHFKLLFDIYHMQIDEGDIIRNITDFHPYLAHYHTAGVPGRHELDDQQELNYPAIMRAIKATGFTGYVAQEFVPRQADKLASLRQAVQLCDV